MVCFLKYVYPLIIKKLCSIMFSYLYSFLPCTFIHVVWFQTLLSALLVFQITLNSHIDFLTNVIAYVVINFLQGILIIQNKSIFINFIIRKQENWLLVIYYSLIQQYHLKDFNSFCLFIIFILLSCLCLRNNHQISVITPQLHKFFCCCC